jgi:NAD(P)-dependent dehydrogenase (short-subunit alcohol dehydrogenase family)
MDLGLEGRVYAVTAATRGLGFASAEALVADGARVVLTGRGQAAVDEAVKRLGGAAVAVGVVADNASTDTGERVIAAARQHFGRIDGVLISAGGPPAGSMLSATDEEWAGAFESVFLGAVRIARRFGSRSAGWRSPTACGRGWRWRRRRSRTSWGRGASGCSACCRPGSTPKESSISTRSAVTRRARGPARRRGFRCGDTGGRRSSGGWRRFIFHRRLRI